MSEKVNGTAAEESEAAKATETMTETQAPPDFAEIKRQAAIGMGYGIMNAPWHDKATTTLRTPKDYGMDYEDIRLPALLDECQIAAWYIPSEKDDGSRLAIVGHQTWTPANKSGMVENETEGQLQIAIDYVKLHKVLHDAGFHVLAYDLRNHGESEHRLPSGFGAIEYRDAAGVMDWVNGHESLKECDVLLLPFCASGNAFLKANSLYPDKFANVKAWVTTNIFQATKMSCDNPTPFNPEHKGFFTAEDINGGFKHVFFEHVEKGNIVETKDVAPFTIERMSAKIYASDVKVPVLFCDPKNDTAFNHINDAPETFAEFPNKESEFHWIGTDQEGPFKTETDNRCEGYNFYQSDGGKGVLLDFVDKHVPNAITKIKRQAAIGMGYGIMNAPWHDNATTTLRTPKDYGMDYLDIRFPALVDKCEIAAWYIKANKTSDGSRLAIVGHQTWTPANKSGMVENETDGQLQIAIDYVKLHKVLYDAGFHVLAYDLRNHGESEHRLPSGFGIIEYRDAAGVMDWVNKNETLKKCDILLMPFCASGNAFLKASSLYPEKFTKVKAWATTNIFQATKMSCDNPTPFNPEHKGFFTAEDINGGFEHVFNEHVEQKNIEDTTDVAPFTIERMSAKIYAPGVGVPVLFCDPKNDTAFNHINDAPETFAAFTNKKSEFHWIGTDQEGPFKTETDNRCEGYNFYQSEGGKGVLLEFVNKHIPTKEVLAAMYSQMPPNIAEIKSKAAIGMGYGILNAPWHDNATTTLRTPKDYGMDYEDIRFPARVDMCQIAAWYIPSKSGSRLAIVGHQTWTPANKSGMVENETEGQLQIAIDYVKLHKVLHDAGFHVLAYDLRNHGESEHRLPSGYGAIEYRDAAGVMDWVNSHETLKECDVLLMPFCASGNAFLKANSLFPEIFTKVKAWATTNIFQATKMSCDNPTPFNPDHKGFFTAEDINGGFKYVFEEHVEKKNIRYVTDVAPFTIEGMSAKIYAADVKVPVLFCDPKNDHAFNHINDAPETFAEFPNKESEFHWIGTDMEGPFKTETNNRCEGYNFYQSDGGKGVLLEFVNKHIPAEAIETTTPPDFAEIKRQAAIGMGYGILNAPWHDNATTTLRTPKTYGMDYEDIRLPALLDKCEIAAWYIPPKKTDNASRLAIVGHQTWTPANKSGMVENHTEGQLQIAIDYVKLHKVLHDAGYHVLAYDLRNHGESEHRLPSGFGAIEYRDAAGVMDWVNSHETLKECDVLLLPFCASGNAFLKANSLYPEKFTKVKAWATTNIFQASKMSYENPTPFNPEHKGFFTAEDINGGFKHVFYEHIEQKNIMETKDVAPFTIERMSAKMYASDVKVPVLFCDPKNDTAFNHVNDAPETFAEFPNKESEFHWIGTDQEGPFKTLTDNRCEGYNFYQSDSGKGVLLDFAEKHLPSKAMETTTDSQAPPNIAEIKRQAAIGMGYGIMGAPWHDNSTTTLRTPLDYGMEYKEIKLEALVDKCEIAAWYIKANSDGSRLAIVGHQTWTPANKSGMVENETEGQLQIAIDYVKLHKVLYDAGFHVLAYDLRNHGESEHRLPSGFGAIEYRDAAGVMDWVNNNEALKHCDVLLLPFCASGNAFLKANSLYPEKFTKVRAWVTTNIFQATKMSCDNPTPFNPEHKGFFTAEDINGGFKHVFDEHVEQKNIEDTTDVAPFTIERMSAKLYASGVGVPVLFCDPKNDTAFNHINDAPETFAEFPNKESEFHWIGTDQEGSFKTETDNRCEGYNFYQSDGGKVVLLDFINKHMPSKAARERAFSQVPPNIAEIKSQAAIGMGYGLLGAPWHDHATTTLLTPKSYGMDYEDIRLPALVDKCEIAAWYIPSKTTETGSRLAIVGHQTWTPANKSGMVENETEGQLQIAIDYVKLHKVLHDAGFHVLAYDLRNHGESEHRLPSGFGAIEYRDAAGVMDWVNSHEALYQCNVLLMPFCASGNAFLKANSLYPEKFTKVKAWATTNIFQASKMSYENPTPFNPQHKGFFTAEDINGGFKHVFDEFVENKSIEDTTDVAPFTIERMSAKMYASDVKVPVLFCDPKNDFAFNHINDAPETFAEFPNKESEFHWIGTDMEGPFKTLTDNRCEGYNFYQSDGGKGVLLDFVNKHVPSTKVENALLQARTHLDFRKHADGAVAETLQVETVEEAKDEVVTKHTEAELKNHMTVPTEDHIDKLLNPITTAPTEESKVPEDESEHDPVSTTRAIETLTKPLDTSTLKAQQDAEADRRKKMAMSAICCLIMIMVIIVASVLSINRDTTEATTTPDSATDIPTVPPSPPVTEAPVVESEDVPAEESVEPPPSEDAPVLESTEDSSLQDISAASAADSMFDDVLMILNTTDADGAISVANSPQNMAYNWMTSDPNIESYSNDTLIQRYALSTLYYSWGGDESMNNAEWLGFEDECNWQGVLCNEMGDVMNLDLGDSGLNGKIPMELGLLSSMTLFNVTRNSLIGALPRGLGELSAMEVFDVSENALSGTIPGPELGSLSDLQELYLNSNSFQGQIPSELGLIQGSDTADVEGGLRILDLQMNDLRGDVPDELSSLSSLATLRIGFNGLSGAIPSSLCETVQTSLTTLYADCFAVDCPCCTYCCDPLITDGCKCTYLSTDLEYLC